MREIKFRAWIIPIKKMCIVNSIEFIDKLEGRTGCNVFIDDKQTIRWYGDFQKRHILMQYTGLKDCNGVEIYEGDVVRVANSDAGEKGKFDAITFVYWDKGGWSLPYLLNKDFDSPCAGGEWTRQLYHKPHRLTVIGNIHENPELL